MKVVIIGAGNVATHLVHALKKINVEITQIWSFNYQNAQVLAKSVNATAINSLKEIDNKAQIAFIAIKDDSIETIAKEIPAFKGLVLHTSGSVSVNVFLGLLENYGVFYPLQTFSKNKALNFKTIPICIEANNDQNLNTLKTFANLLSNHVVEIVSQERKILHLTAVFACNFTNHLYAISQQILEKNNLKFDILRPLIAETAAKVQNTLPLNVQTGPAIRNDKETIKKQEILLQNEPEVLEIYKILSSHIKKIKE